MNCRKKTRQGCKIIPKLFSVIILACILSIVVHSVCFASTVVLQWESSAGASGYKVYYQADSSTRPFGATIDVQNQTTATITGLDKTRSYYFAVVAYSSSKVESSYSNIVSIHPLAVSLSGNGAGTINSSPSGISCSNGTCTAQFGYGSSLNLYATPSSSSDALSYFSGWSGGCSTINGNRCTVNMNASRNATATFTTLQPVNISGGGFYSSLQSAYGAAGSISKIQAQAVTLSGNLTANSNKTITLKGGQNANFSGISGNTVMVGTLTVGKGTLIVDNLVIK